MTMLDRMRRHRGWLKWSLGAGGAGVRRLLHPRTFCRRRRPSVRRRAARGHRRSRRATISRPASSSSATCADAGVPQRSSAAAINEQLLRQLGIDQQILQQMIDEQVALHRSRAPGHPRQRRGARAADLRHSRHCRRTGGSSASSATSSSCAASNPPLTKAQFEETLRRSMMVDKLRTALTDWMAVSDAELEREYRRRNEKVKLQVVALTADKFRDKVTVTDADVAALLRGAQGRVPRRRTAQDQVPAARSRPGARRR